MEVIMRATVAFSITLISFVLFALIPACGDEGCKEGEIDCDGTCIAAIEPTAEAIAEHVFGKSCAQSVCHSGNSPQEGLSLSDLGEVQAAIGTASAQKPEVMLIVAGDAANSYIVNKMRGQNMSLVSSTGKAAGLMPPNSPLCEPKIKAVEDWINAGAN